MHHTSNFEKSGYRNQKQNKNPKKAPDFNLIIG